MKLHWFQENSLGFDRILDFSSSFYIHNITVLELRTKKFYFLISQTSTGIIQFSVQYARNQVFIGAQNRKNDILEVHAPLYSGQLTLYSL